MPKKSKKVEAKNLAPNDKKDHFVVKAKKAGQVNLKEINLQ